LNVIFPTEQFLLLFLIIIIIYYAPLFEKETVKEIT